MNGFIRRRLIPKIAGSVIPSDAEREDGRATDFVFWLFAFIVALATAYVAIRYQCQQDVIAIDRLNAELTDAKYKALSSSSTLTEKCRESHVLDILKMNKDSLLHIADQPPYIINVPE